MVAVSPDGKAKEEFAVPRGLIGAKSAYFDKCFRNGLQETASRQVKLLDVPPYVARCFVAWLYTGRICYDEDRLDPSDIERNGGKVRSDNRRLVEKQSRNGNNGQTSTESLPKPDAGAPDEDDYADPVTWPFEQLFGLYVFADEYDSRGFRVAVMEVIQVKLDQRSPRSYLLPSSDSVKWAVSHLPSSSKLYHLLRDLYATQLGLHNAGGNAQAQGEYFASYPASFVADIFVAAKRRGNAAICQRCAVKGTREECNEPVHHTKDDRLPPGQKDPCTYHEHEGDAEKAYRTMRWEALRKQMYG